MRRLVVVFLLLSVGFAQSNRVEWNPSAPEASKELSDGRTQRTIATDSAKVSAISGVSKAKRMLIPDSDGGADVTFVAIGIQNTSRQTVHIDPSNVTLRIVGKKERDLKRLTEEQVIARAWYSNDRGGPAGTAMVGSLAGTVAGGGANDASMQAATANQRTDTSDRRHQEWSEKNTGQQAKDLRDKALPARDLDPGEQVMGMVFFYPYEAKDKVELSVPVGDKTFVIPFSGTKAKN